MSYFHRVQEMTSTRFWINNVTKTEAELAIAAGAVGCTQNPSYTWKMLSSQDEEARKNANSVLDSILEKTSDAEETILYLQRELIGQIAKQFLPMYQQSFGKMGFVSIQGNPLKETAEDIINFARFNRQAGENIMAKIPVTEEGLKAIKVLVKERVPINATECMALKQVTDVCDAYVEAIQDVETPAPLCFSLISGIFDEYLHNYVRENQVDISEDVLCQAGISVAKKVHQIMHDKKYPVTFIGGGARKLYHFTEMVGGDVSITINWKGTAEELIRMDEPVIQRFLQPTPYMVIDELTEKLEDYRKAYYLNSICTDEYEEYGPVVLFRNSFIRDWTNACEYIQKKIDKRGK